jgi:hypothetical protein
VQQSVATVLQGMLESEFWSSLPRDVGAEEQRDSLLQHPAVAELLLQNMIACTAQLHQRNMVYKQQQQQGKQQPNQPVKQQHRADLLHIPAFHQDMLQLLPGGQAYLDASVAAVAAYRELDNSAEDQQLWSITGSCCSVMPEALWRGPAHQGQADLVSAAAVRLVLALQLLAAGCCRTLTMVATAAAAARCKLCFSDIYAGDQQWGATAHCDQGSSTGQWQLPAARGAAAGWAAAAAGTGCTAAAAAAEW